MIRPVRAGGDPAPSPAVLRLSRLVPLEPGARVALLAATEPRARVARPRAELLREGEEIAFPKLVLTGWAARARVLPDGRRQFLSFVLPGDLVGQCRQPLPLAVSTVVALTEVRWCPAPSADDAPCLADAYAVSQALDEAYLLGQVTRLGRMNAQERIADLLLELYERLELAGLAAHGAFEMPLTQEMLADATALTSVHVNRMLQLLRGAGHLQWRAGRLTLSDPAALARAMGHAAPRVSARAG